MSSKETSPTLLLTFHNGDLFTAPENSVLIHACNTQGNWGAGIAKAFKTKYPNAFDAYHTHCLSNTITVKTGTCQLIPPCEAEGSPKHWIACLFTSEKYGKNKDKPAKILENTRLAVLDLLEQLQQVEAAGKVLGCLRMCKINSGYFKVNWEDTAAVIGDVKLKEGHKGMVEVWEK